MRFWGRRKTENQLTAENEQLRQKLAQYERGWPPGHYYSPIPDLEQVRRDESRLFAEPPRLLPGLDLNEAGQLEWLGLLSPYWLEQPFADSQRPGLRYYFGNDYFTHGDALTLYGFLRHLRPQRVCEIGAGFSSAVVLDTREHFLNQEVACRFIEPDAQRLRSLLKTEDEAAVQILTCSLQEVERDYFRDLQAGDLLLVDSTHVAKIGSDVNYLLFEILPLLSPGVFIHFHDIYFPFEYPKEWVYTGRAWNEAYLLRAFLQYNAAYKICLFNSFLLHFHRQRLEALSPLFGRSAASSLWLQKLL